jgi:hypothetical protein
MRSAKEIAREVLGTVESLLRATIGSQSEKGG